jgi:hypothetical protein
MRRVDPVESLKARFSPDNMGHTATLAAACRSGTSLAWQLRLLEPTNTFNPGWPEKGGQIMRTHLLCSTLFALLVVTSSASAQMQTQATMAAGNFFPPPAVAGYTGYGYGYQPASTAAAGYLMGEASVLQAAGQYNYNTSLGLSFAADAWAKNIVNRVNSVDAYLSGKRANAQYQMAMRGPRATQQQLVTISKTTAPKRLTDYEMDQASGTINWPAVLRQPEFDAYRMRLDDLFAERDPANSGLGTPNYEEIVYLTNLLQQDLKGDIGHLTPAEYVAAKKFLTSLNHEARFTPTLEGVAIR